ncbi:hypothetical protein ACRE_055100 [Hapsidospora chrysogenum ATCC 11550]|uniref:Uncharacterized protein n=1 Tax=Hapsidospora chrysogenum (strain ATCC 11550 / CBS 779.69 / DSM 880 / IAM 14645 / JCM 23072 / IMI 49137) TaxID=857340 RepID=A0A086T2Z1_HAPC1|nr:hypothetical protein ACRE_055100 [Hapsidospora chrysogenum ATCC 11550]
MAGLPPETVSSVYHPDTITTKSRRASPSDLIALTTVRGVDPPRPPRDRHESARSEGTAGQQGEGDEHDRGDGETRREDAQSPQSTCFSTRSESSAGISHGRFLSEREHVLSLQNPDSGMPPHGGARSRLVLPELTILEQSSVPEAALQDVESPGWRTKPSRQSRSTAYPAKKRFPRTVRGLRVKLTGKTPRVASQCGPDDETTLPHATPAEDVGSIQVLGSGQPSVLSKSGSWFRDEHGRPKMLARKVFGKPPWYRKESGEMTSSVSSSIRELLRGRTPPPTPVKECTPD